MPRPNTGHTLEPNAFGIYEIHWCEKGRTRRRSTRTRDLAFAEKILGKFLLLDERERTIESRGDMPMLVMDAFGDPDAPGKDYWTEHVEPNVIDKASAAFARTKILKHFGHLAVRDIMPDDVDDYVAKRRAGEIGRPSVPHTISKELAFLNAAIKHQVEKKRIPATDRPAIKLPGVSQARDVWLLEGEADRLLKAAAEPQKGEKRLTRVYRFTALALGTASRKSALLQMKWDQIDLAAGLVFLNPKGRAQTNKRRPKLPISDELRPILERALEERVSDYVLDHPGSIRTAFTNAVKRAGLPTKGPGVITPHVLRHTWATWAAQGGMDLFAIAGVLGDTVETVTRVYAHHHPDHLRDAVNNVRPSSRPKLRIVA